MLRNANVEALRPGETIWDAGKGSVLGFGARRQKSAAISYMLKYTTRDGRQRWHTIGRHGQPWTVEDARTEALRVLAAVKLGGDPAGIGSLRRRRSRSRNWQSGSSPSTSSQSASQSRRAITATSTPST